ncbi:MAG: HD domain-containing protein [Gemmatimonadota bacterium]
MTGQELHPLILAAAEGRLPDWACPRSSRRPHLAAVAELMAVWAGELALDERDRTRWTAAGWLHDALRDADSGELCSEAGDFPAKVRHGPAAAARLRKAGVNDDELLDAISFHSLGRDGLGQLGRLLYLADYLEPTRTFDPVENAALRARLPADEHAVLRLVCARRLSDTLGRGIPLHPASVSFWNQLAGEHE